MLRIPKLLRGPSSVIRSLNALTLLHRIIVTTFPGIGRWLFRLGYKATYEVRKPMFNHYNTRDIVDYPFSRGKLGGGAGLREEAIGRNVFP